MKTYNEYIGKHFGFLTIIEIIREHNYISVRCNCDCGGEKISSIHSVINGATKSCGCLNNKKRIENGRKKKKDLKGMKFGRLLVLEESPKPKNRSQTSRHIFWKCKCDCGTEKTICSNHLLSGDTISCGCLHYEKITGIPFENRNKEIELFMPYLQDAYDREANSNYKENRKVDITLEDLRDVWVSQHGKCPFTGVELVLKRWDKFVHENRGIFMASLDRKDNKKGYIKGNIQFVSLMINYAKNRYSDDDVIEFCKTIARNWKEKI
jgi:hypothetical protein